MLLRVDAIKFNHDPSSANIDAFNIRKNEREFVEAPEWRHGVSMNPEDSPAAYALFETRGNILTIQASFSCEDRRVNSVDIRAVDGRIYPKHANDFMVAPLVTNLLRPFLFASTGNVLGEVDARNVTFSNGASSFKTFNLKNVRIWDIGVGMQDIVWRWQYRLRPYGAWTDFATTTHRIYITLGKPQEPWQQSPFKSSNIQLPWAAVLDYACRWAATAQNPTDAATLITRRVYQLGTQGIARYCGRAQYAPIANKFRCAQFLFDLKLGSMKLNCTDCATIVSTFANILGAELWQSDMKGFDYNPIKRIGESEWKKEGDFGYHVVAWEEDCDIHNDVFDACLQIDGDKDPTNSDPYHVPLLPTNLRFGRSAEGLYRDRLVALKNPTTAAEPRPHKRNRRPIADSQAEKESKVDTELLELASKSFNLDVLFHDRLAEDKRLFKCVTPNALEGWTKLRSDRVETDKKAAIFESVWRTSDGEALILINIYEGTSIHAAREWFQNSIAGLHSLREICKVQDSFADALFILGNRCGITFVLANLVFALVNIGKSVFPVDTIAQDLFQKLTVNISGNDS